MDIEYDKNPKFIFNEYKQLIEKIEQSRNRWKICDSRESKVGLSVNSSIAQRFPFFIFLLQLSLRIYNTRKIGSFVNTYHFRWTEILWIDSHANNTSFSLFSNFINTISFPSGGQKLNKTDQ